MSNTPNPPGDNSESEKDFDLSSENSESEENTESQQNQDNNSEPLKLWINSNWYIPVDDKGECIGTCFEGALGVVIRLEDEKGRIRALKIPRLMSETYRENAYINDLMKKEYQAVDRVFNPRLDQDNMNPEALLTAYTSTENTLKARTITDQGNEEAQKWNNSLLFVHYEKGLKPQFCLVKPGKNEKLDKFPENSRCPIDSPKAYELVKKYNEEKLTGRWSETIFIVEKEDDSSKKENSNSDYSDDKLEIFSIINLGNQDKKIWYTSLTSITYAWAPGTLQEVISTEQREKWNIRKHLDLVERLCTGLNVLHTKNMLHADLRPANVMYLEDLNEPKNYFLSDYGSFSQANPQSANNNGPGGNTVIGPSIGGERTSPFYSRERRLGREREEGDLAVIYQNANDIYLILGWRSELIGNENIEPDKDAILELTKKSPSQQEDNSSDLLDKGDRIQIREYIFELKAKEINLGYKQILKCKPEIWKIYQNRIVVLSKDSLKEWEWFPIPRTIELLQWSAATDLYSLGVVGLYSVYFNSSEISDKDSSTNNSQSENETLESENNSPYNEEFREMLDYLSSPPYFNLVWQEIEALRIKLEESLDQNEYNHEILDVKYVKPGKSEEAKSPENTDEADKHTLKKEVIRVSNLITDSVPGASKLVTNLDCNHGIFIFFIHFIFCCLHRQSDIISKEDWMEEFPFCLSRKDPPKPHGAAFKAKRRLNNLQDIILENKSILENLKKEIPAGDRLLAKTALSIELNDVKKANNDLRNRISQAIKENQIINNENKVIRREKDEIENELIQKEKSKKTAKTALSIELSNAIKVNNDLKNRISQAIKENQIINNEKKEAIKQAEILLDKEIKKSEIVHAKEIEKADKTRVSIHKYLNELTWFDFIFRRKKIIRKIKDQLENNNKNLNIK